MNQAHAGYDQFPNQTKWTNNTNKPVRIRIRVGPKHVRRADPENAIPAKILHPGYEEYVWQPGDTLYLSSRYDRAIQERDPATGVVMSGMAPQLTRNDEAPRLHEAIDTAHQDRKTAAQIADAALQARASADAALSTAGQRLAAADAREAEDRMRKMLEEADNARRLAESRAKDAEAAAKLAEARAAQAAKEAEEALAIATAPAAPAAPAGGGRGRSRNQGAAPTGTTATDQGSEAGGSSDGDAGKGGA